MVRLDPRRFHDLHAAGFSVFPLLPHSKKPARSWKCFQYRLATADELEKWASDPRGLNVAIVTGSISGNRIVLDLDSREARWAIAKDYGIPHTPTVRTARGWHLYLDDPDGVLRNFAGKLPGVDLRGEGGYVVAPGSVHETGHEYVWMPGLSPDEVPFAPVPEWIKDLIARSSKKAYPRIEPKWIAAPSDNFCSRTRAYVRRALEAAVFSLEGAGPGTRNTSLNAVAYSLGRLIGAGALDPGDVEEALVAASVVNGLLAEDGEGSVRSTIQSGIRAGSCHPKNLYALLAPPPRSRYFGHDGGARW